MAQESHNSVKTLLTLAEDGFEDENKHNAADTKNEKDFGCY